MRVPCCLVTRCRRLDFEIPFINLEIIGLLPIVTSLCGRTIVEIALLAVFRVEYPSPFSWRLTKKSNSCYRWIIWIVLPSMTKLKPLLDIWLILFLGSTSSRSDDDIGSLAWNASLFERSPESLQAISCSWFLKGWSAPLWDCVRRVLEHGRIRGLPVSR